MDLFSIDLVSGSPPALDGLPERPSWRDGDSKVSARIYRNDDADWIDWTSLALFEVPRDGFSIRIWPHDSTAHSSAIAHARERLQPLLMQARDCQVLHAAAVDISGLVVAIAGASGSGKSTLAFALGQRGHAQVADDAVVLTGSRGRPEVLRFPFRPQLRGQSVSLSSRPSEMVSGDGALCPLGAIVLLETTGDPGACGLKRISGPAACIAVLTHAHVFDETDRDARAELVAAYATITNEVPVFRLAYVPRFDRLPELAATIETVRRGLRS